MPRGVSVCRSTVLGRAGCQRTRWHPDPLCGDARQHPKTQRGTGQGDAGVRGTPKKKGRRWGKEGEEGWEEVGCLRCCAGGWYLLSGGDGNPPDAVHVGRVSVGELRGGEVALAVLERLPTGCEGGKAGIRPPRCPRHWDGRHWVRTSRCPQPPCTLLPPKFPAPRAALQKTPHHRLAAATPTSPKPHRRGWRCSRLPGTPSQAPCPPLPGHQAPGVGAIPRPPPAPCPATPRGPGSPPGRWAGLRSRGWIRPSAAIWKPHDAAATAHGASLRLSRGQGGRPPPPARGGPRDER